MRAPPRKSSTSALRSARTAGLGPRADERELDPMGDPERRVPLGLPRPVRGVLTTLGAIAAPPAAVIGLAYYFSVKRQETLARHFGIDNSLLGYSTRDYLVRGADALFLLLLSASLAGLAAIRIHLAVMRRVERGRLPVRWISAAVRGVGAVLLVLGLVAVFRPLPFHPHFLIRSLSFGVGIVLIAYGIYLANVVRSRSSGAGRRTDERRVSPSEWSWLSAASVVLVVVVLLLSVFWTTKDLAQALGRDQARDLENNLALRPAAVVYSDRRLHINSAGVKETQLAGQDGYRFHYTGLRLLVRSGGRYFLIPDRWSARDGVIVVLPDNDTLRLEFSPGHT